MASTLPMQADLRLFFYIYIQLKRELKTVGHLANISYIATSVSGAQICAGEIYRHVS